MRRILLGGALSSAIFTGVADAQELSSDVFGEVSKATVDALLELSNSLPATAPVDGSRDPFLESDFVAVPPFVDGPKIWASTNNQVGGVPLVSASSLIVRVNSTISQEAISAMAEEYEWEILEIYPDLGQMHVRVDLSEFFVPTLDNLDPNLLALQGAINVSDFYTADDRIISATPDVLLQKQEDFLFSPMPQVSREIDLSSQGETTDWGVFDIQADQLWGLNGANSGVILGVLDVGFAEHEDLVFSIGSRSEVANDHGNHVAGIACAQHNGKGVRGVLPSCFVRSGTGEFFPVEDNVNNIVTFLTSFSQILSTIQRFTSPSDGVAVYNLSLGYNWMPNFGINVDEAGAAIYRNFVQMQGEQFIPTLSKLKRDGAVVFSAAGNDGNTLATPMSSRFASPFNWAALAAYERGISDAGIIVEAHDESGRLASFSNIDGMISCPGVRVLSAVSSDVDGYGYMSGTSMASPYCAAGFLLLKLVLPEKNNSEILSCIVSTSAINSVGTPMMRLREAYDELLPNPWTDFRVV